MASPQGQDKNERGLRLLSLGEAQQKRLPNLHESETIIPTDGGGIRGLSELLIIEEIMERIKGSAKLDHVPRPSQYFDLIGGTSTGG